MVSPSDRPDADWPVGEDVARRVLVGFRSEHVDGACAPRERGCGAERALAVPPLFDLPESVPLRPIWDDGLVAITDSMLHTTAGDGDVARMARYGAAELATER